MARRRMAQERMAAPAYAGNGFAYREAQDLDVESRPGRSAGVREYGRQPGAPAPRARVSAPRGRVEASNANGNGNAKALANFPQPGPRNGEAILAGSNRSGGCASEENKTAGGGELIGLGGIRPVVGKSTWAHRGFTRDGNDGEKK